MRRGAADNGVAEIVRGRQQLRDRHAATVARLLAFAAPRSGGRRYQGQMMLDSESMRLEVVVHDLAVQAEAPAFRDDDIPVGDYGVGNSGSRGFIGMIGLCALLPAERVWRSFAVSFSLRLSAQ